MENLKYLELSKEEKVKNKIKDRITNASKLSQGTNHLIGKVKYPKNQRWYVGQYSCTVVKVEY